LVLPRRCSKHVEQYTGLSPLGWNGTWASWPQLEHVALNISRAPRAPPPDEYPPPPPPPYEEP
jgi:hypothetical protein